MHGYKLCHKCKNEMPASSRMCPHEWCGALQPIKKKKLKNPVKDWKKLERGNIIKVHCYDFWQADSTTVPIKMDYSGEYTVIEVQENQGGILCHNRSGYQFVNMASDGLSDNNIMKSPPQLEHIKNARHI